MDAMGSTIEHEIGGSGASKSGCGSIGGKLFASVILLAFLVGGSFFLVFLRIEFSREMAPYFWQATPATVIASSVEDSGDDENPYRWSLSYRYSFEGRDYIGSQPSLTPRTSANYDEVQRKVIAHPTGSTLRCWVNPKWPDESVVERRSPLYLLFALLPLLFVVIGGGGLYFLWRGEKPEPETVSISKKAREAKGAYFMPIVLGLIFVAVGGGLFIAIGVVPAVRLVRAASWIETPCTILSSTVRSYSSDDGTTYKADILYEYQAESLVLRSNRYDFANFSSSGYEAKREIVDRYQPGSRSVCYVDPDDPTWAVLNRDFRPAYLVGLFPLVFLLVGAGVARWGFSQRREKAARMVGGTQTEAEHEIADGPTLLEPKQSRSTKILGSIIFAVIWNGVLGIFLYNLISEWMQGDRQWFLAFFLVPFVIVGLGAIVMVVYFSLAALNPRPRVTLSAPAPRLGQQLGVRWLFEGRPKRIRTLSISLEGREEATYQRGTDTHTDREVFARLSVVQTEAEYQIAQGDTELTIPDDTMHSFDGDNNKIVWSIVVKGDVPRWPDIDAEFPLTVRPLAAGNTD
jgi:hypothetical protein